MGLIGSPKTSVSTHLMPRNNPEDQRIQFNSGGSLRSRTVKSNIRSMSSKVSRHKDIGGSKGRAPRILKLDITWTWVVGFKPQSFYAGQIPRVTHCLDAVGKKRHFCTCQKMHSGCPVHSPAIKLSNRGSM